MGRTRVLGRALLAFVAIVALVILSPAPATAETTLEVTTPADGRYQSGRPTPLIVTIEADRAIAGTLSATFEGFRIGSQRVEVPGGSAKDVVFVISLPPWTSSGTLTFTGDDEDDNASTRVDLIQAGGDELVAVLGDLGSRDIPPSANLITEIGVARLFDLDTQLLSSGADILGPFTQLVTTADDLAALDPTHLDAVETWVGSNGGILIVDDPPGTSLPFDPTSVSADSATATFGLGQVVFSDGQAAAGNYDDLFRPTPSRSPNEFPWGGEFGGSFPTTTILASDAGVRIPAIGSIVLVLLAYAAVVGPLLWFLLRRSRREPLLWLAVPAIALVTTGGVYVAGQALREDTSVAHATLYADLPSQRVITTEVLVTAPNGGRPGVDLPAGWEQSQNGFNDEVFFEGPFGGGSVSTATPQRDGDQLVVDLPPGGIGVIGAETTSDPTGQSWSYELTAEDGELSGTITNLTTHDLEEVYVTSGRGFTRIPRVDAGQTVEVNLRGASLPPINGDPLTERLFREDMFSGNPGGVMNPGLLVNWMSGRPELRMPGFIMIVGWTRDETSPLTTSTGAVVEAGRTAYLTADRLDATLLADAGGSVEFIRGWGSTRVDDPIANQCADFPVTTRYGTAPGAEAADLVLALERRAIAGFDVWDGTAWIPGGMVDAVDNDVVVSLPANALVDGELYVRMQMTCDFWGMSDPFPQLRAPTADDAVVTLGDLASAGEEPSEDEDTA